MSKKICTLDEFDDTIIFKAHCGCANDSHIQTLFLERSEDDLSLSIYCNTNTPYWKDTFFERLKKAIKLVFTGYIEYETSFIFTDKQQVNDYVNALIIGIAKLNNNTTEEK